MSDITFFQESLISALRPVNDPKYIDTLYNEVSQCTRCPIHVHMGKCPLYRGNVLAPIAIVSEKSGPAEAKAGYPLAGGSGYKIEELFREAGIPEPFWNYVKATNIVICHIPDNTRSHSQREIKNCKWWEAFLDAYPPKLILALGKLAVKELSGIKRPFTMGKVNGKTFRYKGIRCIATYNPAYLLRLQSAGHTDLYEKAILPWKNTIRAGIRRALSQ